ncbi:MAG: hypothetical protein KF876_09655 [Nitrospira sp.]|nr:hypothetical protein [Nitrospira sp.]MDR4463752.1 hypothetical protein [Nitrospira sp.]MDR4468644.1 hypothetical protein [Nitrospira sp.]
MRLNKIFVLIVSILSVTVILSQVALADPGTAREWLPAAIKSAQSWKADAKLVQVTTLEAFANGSAKRWSYIFFSESSKKGYKVHVREGKVGPNQALMPDVTLEVPLEFVDSSLAMEEAKRKGATSSDGIGMILQYSKQGLKEEGLYWNVTDLGTEQGVILVKAR